MFLKNKLIISLYAAATALLIDALRRIPTFFFIEADPVLRWGMLFSILFIAFSICSRTPFVRGIIGRFGKERTQQYALLNNLHSGILVIDPQGRILFHNLHFETIFNKIANWIPIKTIDALFDYNYFEFYLNPDEQRALFARLIDRSKKRKENEIISTLDIGSEIISARAVPLHPDSPSDRRIMVIWDLITRQKNQSRWEKVVEEQIENTSGELTAASNALMASSVKVKEIAQDTSKQAQDVASFSREVTELILKLSDAVNRSASKIDVISENVGNSRKISASALDESRSSRRLITELSDMAGDISKSTQSIQEIMAQTHVLSLNATIEAARAGEAGKGFAVIANEVGNLAKQTAAMSEEITRIVDLILEKIPLSVSSIETVESVVREMNGITLSIVDLMDEQTEMMSSMNDHMKEANDNSEQITQRMDEVVSYSYNTLEQIEKSRNAGKDIASIAELFHLIVSRFGEERIVTPNDIYHMLTIIQQLIDAWISKELPEPMGRELSVIPLETFEGKKPANVLKTAMEAYQCFLTLNSIPHEAIPFPKGTVTPTQTYNFLCKMMESVEAILKARKYDHLRELKQARPVTGKTPNDAFALAHSIHSKLQRVPLSPSQRKSVQS